MLATTLLIRVVRNINFWRGNYRDKDMPRYDLTIAIFDTIRYIVPSLFTNTVTNGSGLKLGLARPFGCKCGPAKPKTLPGGTHHVT